MKRLLFIVLLGAALTLLLRHYVGEGVLIASGSMEPTLLKGEHHVLEKITIRFRPLLRGDIVAFPSPVEQGKDLIKRVIGLPGDEIVLKNKDVFVNGTKLNEPYVKHTRPDERLEGDILGPLVVPEDGVFMMGDNRDESGDSRDWKDSASGEHMYFVPLKSIKGRIVSFW